MNRIKFALGEAHASAVGANAMPASIARYPVMDHHHDAGVVRVVGVMEMEAIVIIIYLKNAVKRLERYYYDHNFLKALASARACCLPR